MDEQEFTELVEEASSPDELFDQLRPERQVPGSPHVEAISPSIGTTSSRVEVTGHNLAEAFVFFGSYRAEMLERGDNRIVVEVPDVERASPEGFAPPDESGPVTVLVHNGAGVAIAEDAFQMLPATWGTPEQPHTFAAPQNAQVAPSKQNQKYLVLMVLPNDKSIPAGKTEADMHADLESKLVSPAPSGKSAGGFWEESSYGKTSFDFDVYDSVIDLDDAWFDYFHPAGPKRIDGVGATYPVTWTGGETLALSSGGFTVSVSFLAGDQTISAVQMTINDAVETESQNQGLSEVPFRALDNGGQLRLQTTSDGASAALSVDGGTARAPLGLNSPTVTPGVDHLDRRTDVFVEAMEKRTSGMTDAQAQSFLSGYEGVIVSHAVAEDLSYYRANASIGSWNFSVRGGSFDFANIYMTNGYPWQVFTHELGHNLGFPDLYDEPGPPELVGQELGSWDIMQAGWIDSHPSAWIKSRKSGDPASTTPGFDDPWMDPSDVLKVDPPAPNNTRIQRALVVPSSTDMPASNPFAGSHPGVPLVHALRLKLQKNNDIYVEAREEGPYTSSTFDDAEYDADIPTEGVVVTDAIDDLHTVPIYRANATLLTPHNDPIDQVSEVYTRHLQGQNELTITCNDVIGEDPTVYDVEIEWGPGEFTDLRIDTWNPPPWESSDIWVDTQVDNDWDEYSHSDPGKNPGVAGNPVLNGDRSRVAWPGRLYARVWNDGTAPANDVEVIFRVVLPAGNGPGFEVGKDTILTIAPGDFGLAQTEWTPKKSTQTHVCIKAEVLYQSDELNANNNVAQENFIDWYVESGSAYQPQEFEFKVHNPLSHTAPFRVDVDGLRSGYYVDVDPVEMTLEPGEERVGNAAIQVDEGTPLDEGWRRRELEPPDISLEFLTQYGCSWLPVGGISGTVHTVLSTNIETGVERLGDGEALLIVVADANGRPVRGTNVSVRLWDGDEPIEETFHGKTDNDGEAQVTVRLPQDYSTDQEYVAEVVVAPTEYSGPADGEVSLEFQ